MNRLLILVSMLSVAACARQHDAAGVAPAAKPTAHAATVTAVSIQERISIADTGAVDRITVNRVRFVSSKLAERFPEDAEAVARLAFDAVRELEEVGLRTRVLDVLECANERQFTPGKSFRAVCAAYVAHRTAGDSHLDAMKLAVR